MANTNGINSDDIKEHLDIVQSAIQFGYTDIYDGAKEASDITHDKNLDSMNTKQQIIDKRDEGRIFGKKKEKKEE